MPTTPDPSRYRGVGQVRKPERRDFVLEFIDELRRRATDSIFGGSAEARVCARIANELEAKRAAYLEEEVSIAEAAEITGYDASSLRRWRAQGTISLCRRDLPRKPGHGVAAPVRRAEGSGSIADEVLHDIQMAGGRAGKRATGRERPRAVRAPAEATADAVARDDTREGENREHGRHLACAHAGAGDCSE